MPESPSQSSARQSLKSLSARLMRPGLAGIREQIEVLDERVAELHSSFDQSIIDRIKYDSELEYWRYLVKRGGAEKDFGESFEIVFGRWTRQRLLKLGAYLGLPKVGEPGNIDEWCRERSVVEIGAGPSPAIAAAQLGWKRCVAVDPIARGYAEEGLVPRSCQHVVYIEAPGERIPLASGFADIVVCENCLDHVSDPADVIREIARLLMPGGYLWLFVDLSEHQDHLHPHPMSDVKIRKLLRGFQIVRDEVSDHRAHPEAYGGYRVLCRKPLSPGMILSPLPAAAQELPLHQASGQASTNQIPGLPSCTHGDGVNGVVTRRPESATSAQDRGNGR